MELRPQSVANKYIKGCIAGVIISVIALFILMFLVTKFNIGIFGLTSKNNTFTQLLSKSIINSYLVQHITIAGKGVGSDGKAISSAITLPTTLWIIIPVLVLFIGGYIADKVSGQTNKRYLFSPAFSTAIIYTFALIVLTNFVKSNINDAFFPDISGTSIVVPEIMHRPVWQSVLIFAGMLSLIFTYFGHLAATHRRHITDDSEKGKWWICLKSILIVMIVFQVILALIFVPKISGMDQEKANSADKKKIYQMLPTATGIVYGMMFGFDGIADVKSTFKLRSEAYRPLSIKAGVMDGVVQNDDNRKSDKKFSSVIKFCILIFGALIAFISGLLAVRWGVRGGFVPVGLRITIFYAIVLAITYAFSSMFLRYSDALSSTNVYIGLVLNKSIAFYTLMIFAASMIGAQIGRHKKTL